MNRWALIAGGIVATVVEQDDQPVVAGFLVVACNGTMVSSGWLWNGSAFVAPPVLVALPLREFWRRFTVAEREALQNILATGTQTQKNKLNAFRDYLAAGGNVELYDDYVIASVTLMESAGILSAGRAAIILAP